MQVFVTINNAGIKKKCRCECKESIDKGACNKGFIWNPSNCEYECDKSCDIGEYLDYENCRCRKKLFGRLVEEYMENVDEAKITEIIENKCKFLCTIYVVIIAIVFTVYLFSFVFKK